MTGLCQDCYNGLDPEIDHSATLCYACQARRAAAPAASETRSVAPLTGAAALRRLGPPEHWTLDGRAALAAIEELRAGNFVPVSDSPAVGEALMGRYGGRRHVN